MPENLLIAMDPIDVVDRLKTEAHRAAGRNEHDLAYLLRTGASTIIALNEERQRLISVCQAAPEHFLSTPYERD